MNSTVRTVLFWVLIFAMGFVLWKMASNGGPTTHEDQPNYSNFLAKVESGNVKDVTISLSPNSAAKHAAESKRGAQYQSIDPSRPTSAALRQSPIMA